jgi:hypothetical protein
MFTAALLTIAKKWKQCKRPSTDEWIKKMWYLHTMEDYSATKKIKSCHLWQIDKLEFTILSGISQT